ncbi:MAG: phenylalanine--tRNA ligase subunit beta, partial [Candidatus Omnitrophica bacterium]|nr:phenylalanine--tRNA ligase subunit beta [Candidatus Omnitrophota bacterium]
MKVTYNWLKDFVDIKLSPQALADKLTMAGIEVSAIEEKYGDYVFEIEITSNRPDWLSVIGLAREVAAITGGKLKSGLRVKGQGLNKNLPLNPYHLTLTIEDEKDCPLYTAKIIRGVKVGASPDWMRKRLEMVGLRSVNNIVDITNYVLFQTGEPLHAFDLDKLSGPEICVRRARQGEKIITIDDKTHNLNPGILVIADKNNPVAIAGVMGGKESEVNFNTKNMLLEAAVFDPITIRRSRQAVGLNSESSYRFERGVPLDVAITASLKAAELILNSAAGTVTLAKQQGKIAVKPKTINVSNDTVNRLLGVNVKPALIKSGLSALGFKVKAKTKNNFAITVPAFRPDVNLVEDVVEEIARVYGYDKIPVTIPAIKPQLAGYSSRDLILAVKNTLVCLGLSEVVTYSMVDNGLLADFNLAQEREIVEILNPLSQDQDILRPSLIPSLASRIAFNLNRKQEYINIFETADIYRWQDNSDAPVETPVLGLAFCGSRSIFFEQGSTKDNAGFLHVKGVIGALFERLKIPLPRFAESTQNPSEISIFIKNESIGRVIILSKKLLERLDIKNRQVCAAEIHLDNIMPFCNS